MDQIVEFIESYVKHGSGDYEWRDNHGELVRCRDCIHYDADGYCNAQWRTTTVNWFCADGTKGGEAK